MEQKGEQKENDGFDVAHEERAHLAYAQKVRADPDIRPDTAEWMIAQDRASCDERKMKAEVDRFCREHIDPALRFATLDIYAVGAVLLSGLASWILLSPWDPEFPQAKYGALVFLLMALCSAAADSSIARAAIRRHLESRAKPPDPE
jgi:hypothetical protein